MLFLPVFFIPGHFFLLLLRECDGGYVRIGFSKGVVESYVLLKEGWLSKHCKAAKLTLF